MSTLTEREQGFERRFANDQELEFLALSRRDRMLAEWAAGLMGLEAVEDYVQAVQRTHLERPADEDVLRKVSEDLAGAGLAVRESEVRAKMDEFLAVSRTLIREGA